MRAYQVSKRRLIVLGYNATLTTSVEAPRWGRGVTGEEKNGSARVPLLDAWPLPQLKSSAPALLQLQHPVWGWMGGARGHRAHGSGPPSPPSSVATGAPMRAVRTPAIGRLANARAPSSHPAGCPSGNSSRSRRWPRSTPASCSPSRRCARCDCTAHGVRHAVYGTGRSRRVAFALVALVWREGWCWRPT